MTSIIERVAKALAFSEGSRIISPGQSEAARTFGWKANGKHFEEYKEANWRNYIVQANFAIQAIISEVHHEAQDTEFDTGFEAFRDQLKEALK